MTRWQIWKTVLLTLGFWTLILSVGIIGGQILSKDETEASPGKEEFAYSLSGPNALARSALVERQEILQFKCEELQEKKDKISDRNLFRNLLVDDQHKLLYCYVPKVACTNWKRVLMIAMGKWRGHDPLEIPADLAHAQVTFNRLSNFTVPEIEQKLATYDKLLVVRHPLERLLSAYRNKFENKNEKSSKYFLSRFGKKIIKKYRVNVTEESLMNGYDVTFPEFVDFVTDDSININKNEHWISIYELCHPCTVNYNLISKYESLVEDATEVLERMGVKAISFPPGPQSREPTVKKLERYYSTLNYKQLRKLINLYKYDFKLFDYTLEEVLGFSLA